jgi:hypothetical protein
MSQDFNFTSENAVTLNHPLSVVFSKLAEPAGLSSTIGLSTLARDFTLLEQDSIALPSSTSLSHLRARTLPPATAPAESGHRLLPRQAFKFREEVPIAGGLFKQSVHLAGTQAWDRDARVALYEALSEGQGITVWKLREFEELPDGNTRVKERIEGICPAWMRLLVQPLARKAHRYVLASHVF